MPKSTPEDPKKNRVTDGLWEFFIRVGFFSKKTEIRLRLSGESFRCVCFVNKSRMHKKMNAGFIVEGNQFA